jgi:hypothetical protein
MANFVFKPGFEELGAALERVLLEHEHVRCSYRFWRGSVRRRMFKTTKELWKVMTPMVDWQATDQACREPTAG